MTTQTPDAVREARRIAANVLGLPPGLRSEYMNGKYDTGDHVRIALAALDSRAGDAGEGKELFLVSLALSKPFAGGTTYSMSQSWRTGGTEQEAIDAAIMFAAKEKPGFGVWNMLIARVPLSATPAPAVDAKARADMAAALRNTPAEALREAGYLERAATMIEAPAVDAVPAGEVERLARIRTSMALLQQNSEGCAQNHYGDDAAVHGMPGWLVDTKADLDAFTKILARREADCG